MASCNSNSESTSGPETRKQTYIKLIGYVDEKICGMKLPTSRQVLSLFFHKHKSENMTVRESARFAVREVSKMWDMARIPTTIERNAIERLENLFHRWKKLLKNEKRQTKTQRANEITFEEEIDKLFDIAQNLL